MSVFGKFHVAFLCCKCVVRCSLENVATIFDSHLITLESWHREITSAGAELSVLGVDPVLGQVSFQQVQPGSTALTDDIWKGQTVRVASGQFEWFGGSMFVSCTWYNMRYYCICICICICIINSQAFGMSSWFMPHMLLNHHLRGNLKPMCLPDGQLWEVLQRSCLYGWKNGT